MGYNPDFSLYKFIITSLKTLVLFTFTFSLFEKVNKEKFVVGITNAKTKKILLSILNQSPYPIALVSKNG
jgi:hypothetical protein